MCFFILKLFFKRRMKPNNFFHLLKIVDKFNYANFKSHCWLADTNWFSMLTNFSFVLNFFKYFTLLVGETEDVAFFAPDKFLHFLKNCCYFLVICNLASRFFYIFVLILVTNYWFFELFLNFFFRLFTIFVFLSTSKFVT